MIFLKAIETLMKKLLIYLLISFTPFQLFGHSLHDTEVEHVDNIWDASYTEQLGATAGVNGMITHGDEYIVRIVGEECDLVNQIFFFYTYEDYEKVKNIENKTIYISLNGYKIHALTNEPLTADATYVSPFLMGTRVLFDSGITLVENMKKGYGRIDAIEIELIDSENFKISNYFDIPKNAWSTNGMVKALDDAVLLCKKN